MRIIIKTRIGRLLRGEFDHDTINVFVKQEAHKRSKLDSGRVRLISGVSFVDCMIDRILWGVLGRKALSTLGRTPVYYGWSPLRGQYRTLLNKLGKGEIMALDKEAWDWNVRGWMLRELFACFTSLCVDETDWWLKLAWMRWQCLFKCPTFEFSDGDVFKQTHWGVMKSGCYLTLLGNSVMQWILNEVACSRMAMEVPISIYIGDDSIQAGIVDHQQLIRRMEELGVKCKEPTVTRGHCEFVGMRMDVGGMTPAYREKHEFQLRHVNPEVFDETISSYMMLYAHDERVFKALAGLVTDNGLHRLRSRRYWLTLVDQGLD